MGHSGGNATPILDLTLADALRESVRLSKKPGELHRQQATLASMLLFGAALKEFTRAGARAISAVQRMRRAIANWPRASRETQEASAVTALGVIDDLIDTLKQLRHEITHTNLDEIATPRGGKH